VLAERRDWKGLAISSDGTILSACDDYVYLSTDSGATWIKRTSSGLRVWTGIAASADGSKIFGITRNGYIYVSIDYGATWAEKTLAGARRWNSIACSADGSTCIAVSDGPVFMSTNYGTSWQQNMGVPVNIWMYTACSIDATVIGIAVAGNMIYISRDKGVNWTPYFNEETDTKTVKGIAISPSGMKIGIIFASNTILTSQDSGETWTEQPGSGSKGWIGIAIYNSNGTSDDTGKKFIAIAENDYIYTSDAAGQVWTPQTSLNIVPWKIVVASLVSPTFAICTGLSSNPDSGYIYTGRLTG
jgi:photosystem II stability/assembly factor-like uncharacterized protein